MPPTYTSVPDTARAVTVPTTPLALGALRLRQLLPFQRAMLVAGTLPARSNFPPTYSSEPVTASACTLAAPTVLATPLPTVFQPLEPQAARLLAPRPPAWVKAPPTYRVLPIQARAYTVAGAPDAEPLMPVPRLLQLLPFQRATLLASTPPALAKRPPTYTSVPAMAMACTAVLNMPSDTPLPRLCQALPSHLAMHEAGTPPAPAKEPPTYTSVPLMAIACTIPATPSLVPVPSVAQVLPFQRAMLLTFMPPTCVKLPPTYTSLPATATAYTLGSRYTKPAMPFVCAEAGPKLLQLLPAHLARPSARCAPV